MEAVARTHSSSRTSQKNQSNPMALRREEINRLLWDFYGDFPLSMTEWQEVEITPKKATPNRSARRC